ncbi:DinB family protein [Bacillus songklensis]
MLHLFAYHQWGNLELVHHIGNLPQDVYQANIQSVFPSIKDTFSHMVAVDRLWFERIKGNREAVQEEKPMNTAEAIGDEMKKLYQEMRTYLQTIDHNYVVSYSNSRKEMFQNNVMDLIHHLVNHGTYHRGNITAMLHQQGYRSVSTDYIYYLRR